MSSDDKNVLDKPKTKRIKLFTRSHLDTLPIKIVTKTNTKSNLQSDKLLVGNSLNTVVLGILKNSNKPSKRMWHVLLDSGSNGDLLFVQKGLKENVPFKERFRPQKWQTSNGTFRTTKVGDLDMIFPEFSESNIIHLKPDIVDILEKDVKPALFLG